MMRLHALVAVCAALQTAAAQPCASLAGVRLDVGEEIVLPLASDAASDAGRAVDLVERRGLASGGGCDDAARRPSGNLARWARRCPVL